MKASKGESVQAGIRWIIGALKLMKMMLGLAKIYKCWATLRTKCGNETRKNKLTQTKCRDFSKKNQKCYLLICENWESMTKDGNSHKCALPPPPRQTLITSLVWWNSDKVNACGKGIPDASNLSFFLTHLQSANFLIIWLAIQTVSFVGSP